MADPLPLQSRSKYPPGVPAGQLAIRFEVVHERQGECRVKFWAPEDSPLVAKYGGKGRALAACRDILVDELDLFIREFIDEE
ncbi:MAG: hypothetical protein WD834_07325 [Actinomycetota bacterium]